MSKQEIIQIDISELHDSPDNCFNIDRVEEFAETILEQGGVKENLVVIPLKTGGYGIISGHRRKAAVQLLIDRGENISRYLPCLVQEYPDDDNRKLDSILMNVSARRLSDAELMQSYVQLDAIVKKGKKAGQRFGKIRETLAEYLGVSPAQIGKMQNVEKNAIVEVKEAVENGEISISIANEIAKLDENKQEELVQTKDLSSIKHKDVKKQVSQAKSKIAHTQKVDTYINSSNNDEAPPEPNEIVINGIRVFFGDKDVNQNNYKTEEMIKVFGQYIMDNHEDISDLLETCKKNGINKPIVNELLELINDNCFSEKEKRMKAVKYS